MVDPTRVVPLWQVLCVGAALGCLTGRLSCARAGMGLLLNWCVLTAYATATNDQYAWPINAAVDYVTVLVALIPINKKMQAVLVGTFALGMVFHASYGMAVWLHGSIHSDMVKYWWRFHYLAWSQAALVIVWSGAVGGFSLVRWAGNRRVGKPMGAGGALACDRKAR